jgi:hypothetical protein
LQKREERCVIGYDIDLIEGKGIITDEHKDFAEREEIKLD